MKRKFVAVPVNVGDGVRGVSMNAPKMWEDFERMTRRMDPAFSMEEEKSVHDFPWVAVEYRSGYCGIDL